MSFSSFIFAFFRLFLRLGQIHYMCAVRHDIMRQKKLVEKFQTVSPSHNAQAIIRSTTNMQLVLNSQPNIFFQIF